LRPRPSASAVAPAATAYVLAGSCVAERRSHPAGTGASSRSAAVIDPGDRFGTVLVTGEWTPLEPRNLEDKIYAAGVGNVLVVLTAGEHGRMELNRFTPGN
jgi:hypothetical protein